MCKDLLSVRVIAAMERIDFESTMSVHTLLNKPLYFQVTGFFCSLLLRPSKMKTLHCQLIYLLAIIGKQINIIFFTLLKYADNFKIFFFIIDHVVNHHYKVQKSLIFKCSGKKIPWPKGIKNLFSICTDKIYSLRTTTFLAELGQGYFFKCLIWKNS